MTVGKIAVDQWLALRKDAAKTITPDTAEVTWCYRYGVDPYGVCDSIPDELQCVGREYFARAPGSDVWVWFGDLPEDVRSTLRERHRSGLAFHAGIASE